MVLYHGAYAEGKSVQNWVRISYIIQFLPRFLSCLDTCRLLLFYFIKPSHQSADFLLFFFYLIAPDWRSVSAVGLNSRSSGLAAAVTMQVKLRETVRKESKQKRVKEKGATKAGHVPVLGPSSSQMSSCFGFF
jgi:hypothetical protein